MRKQQCLFFTALLALPLMLTAVTAPAELLAPVQQEPMTWEGSASSQKEAFVKVVENEKEWSALWKQAFDQPAPAVDFKTSVVACLFLGHDADWLYSIGFGKPYLRGNTWIMPYELSELVLELAGPFKASGQYYMKVFEKKKDAQMILQASDPAFRTRIPFNKTLLHPVPLEGHLQ
jgi:hypothetical protein